MKRHCLKREQALFLIIDLQEKLMKAMDHTKKEPLILRRFTP